MRLSFLCHEFPPIGGGAASALDAVTRALARRGHAVQVATIALGDEGTRGTDESGREVVRFAAGRRAVLCPSSWELFRSYSALRRLAGGALLDFSPEVLIAYFGFPAGHAAISVGRKLKVPVVVSLRGSDVPGFSDARWGRFLPIRSSLTKSVWRKADLLLANGETLCGLAKRFMPDREIINLPNGVDTGVFSPANGFQRQGPPRILYVGQLIERKNCLELLRGLEWLAKRGGRADVTIVGEGPLRSSLEGMSRGLGDSIRVEFIGYVDRQRIPETYRAHDVIVHLSRAEGVSNVLLEAMAAGLCVIATRSATGGIISGGEDGIVLDSATPEAVGGALLQVSVKSEERDRLRKRAREIAEAHDWESSATRLETHLRAVVGGR